MQHSRWAERLFDWIAGTAPGAGMTVIMVVFGVLTILAMMSGYIIPQIRKMEDILPDHDQLEKT
jgi:hypothetical protein